VDASGFVFKIYTVYDVIQTSSALADIGL